METSQLDPKLSLQPFDPEVFRRVWERVMPDQALSPVVMGASSQPAAPAFSPAPEPPETAPEIPLTCLGEGSRPYAQIIQDMTEQTRGFSRSLHALARRSGGRAARVLSGIAGDLRREERRLSTAHFLITGERYAPSQTGTGPSGSLAQALRTLFQQFHQRAAQARAAAQEMGDPCLQQLFQDLGEDAEFYAQRLRALLEEMP